MTFSNSKYRPPKLFTQLPKASTGLPMPKCKKIVDPSKITIEEFKTAKKIFLTVIDKNEFLKEAYLMRIENWFVNNISSSIVKSGIPLEIKKKMAAEVLNLILK